MIERSWDELVIVLAWELHAAVMEHIARKERDGVPADIADKHKAEFAVAELFAVMRGVAGDPPADCGSLGREVWAAIAEKLANPHQI